MKAGAVKPGQAARNVYAYAVAKWEANEGLYLFIIGTLIFVHALHTVQAMPGTESKEVKCSCHDEDCREN
jgi:hypothetical protein